MTPLLSVVTIVKNDLEGLQLTFENVQSLKTREVEQVVVDGASTDGSRTFLVEHDQQIDRWISEEDSGISNAFNKGLGMARGEWVLFLNARDQLNPNSFQALLTTLQKSEAALVYADMQTLEEPSYTIHADHKLLHKEMSLNHPATFVRRKTLMEIGGFDESYHIAMDYQLLMRLMQSGARFEHLPLPVSVMDLHGVSQVNWKRGYREVLRTKRELFGNRMGDQLFYYRQCFTFLLQRFLKRIGLNRVVQFYRARLSPIKKTSS
jgi:glycosyltransferase involved in cell wall biosynthesis